MPMPIALLCYPQRLKFVSCVSGNCSTPFLNDFQQKILMRFWCFGGCIFGGFIFQGLMNLFLLLVWFLSLCVARWEPEGTGGVEERQRWIFYTPQSAHTRTDTQPGHAIPPYSSTTPKISQFSDFPQLVN